MKTYVGAKIIGAEPLTLGMYNEFKGRDMPEGEDSKRDGYLVVYSSDYSSWSPKEVFEEVYRLVNVEEHALVVKHS